MIKELKYVGYKISEINETDDCTTVTATFYEYHWGGETIVQKFYFGVQTEMPEIIEYLNRELKKYND